VPILEADPKSRSSVLSSGIERAIEAAGGPLALAKLLKVSHQVVYEWRKRGWVPPERALQLKERFKIPLAKLVNPKIGKLIS
jgi:hypothetical protein